MLDLIVIGGGPAGTAAAITAVRGGARVLLLDRGRFPRHKVCGEFVSAESLELLSDLLDPSQAGLLREAPRLAGLRMFVDGRVIRARVAPAAASVARYDLDAALWESAMRAGVEARQQTAVQAVSESVPFTVTIAGEQVEARAVINATGRWSNLNAAANAALAQGATRYIGVKGHFSERDPAASVDLYFFDGGYCGVSAVALAGDRSRSRVNACAMVRADVASSIEQVLGLHPELCARARGWQPLSDAVTTSPLIFREPEPVRSGVLCAGDAAAFVDPFTGDGISIALRGGALAGRCLLPALNGECSYQQAVQAYRTEYQWQLAGVYRVSSRLRQMLAWPRAVRMPVLLALEKAPRVTEYLIQKTRAGAR